MITELTRDFINTNPTDEEMSRFLEEHYKSRHLVHDDIIAIIERMQDEKNKHKAIYKYAQGDLLFFKKDAFFNIVVNINDQKIGEILEYIIIQRLKNQMETDPKRGKEIAHSVYEYLNSLEQMGRNNEESDYVDRVKDLLENVAEILGKIDLLTFLYNMDLSKWSKEELYKYEYLLEASNFEELLEEWQTVQNTKSKAIANKAFEEAEKEGVSLEDVAKDFLETAKSKGVKMDKLYEWIIQNNSDVLIIEQRAEMQEGLTNLKGKEVKQPDKNK